MHGLLFEALLVLLLAAAVAGALSRPKRGAADASRPAAEREATEEKEAGAPSRWGVAGAGARAGAALMWWVMTPGPLFGHGAPARCLETPFLLILPVLAFVILWLARARR